VSAEFCSRVLAAAAKPLPAPVADAARRSLFNVLGTAVGASRTAAVEAVLATAAAERITGAVAVPGRAETLNSHWGALAAGVAAHLDDFDDTHLPTVIHPGAAVMATLLGLQPEADADGARFLVAFAFGCEAQLRIGNAISPSHYDRGWHITGTCGVFGAAVAAALLLGLDATGLERALSMASFMVLGHREGFGSMTKSFHPGKAAANGILAARLARAGLAGTSDPLGPDGVLSVLADTVDWAALADDSWSSSRSSGPPVRSWELELNTFKPYPCGIVAHPVIDAAVDAAARIDDAAAITGVSVTCNPLVPELMGRRQPADGLQARFSAHHAAAAGLLDGSAGLAQFLDDRVNAGDARRLRSLITLVPDPSCARDEATMRVEFPDGDPVVVHVAHARGSLERPLTDDELFAKVNRLVAPVLGDPAAGVIRRAVDELAEAPDLDGVLASIRPQQRSDAASGNGSSVAEGNRA
jgi:2-methylcitrate dehydratase PrpD